MKISDEIKLPVQVDEDGELVDVDDMLLSPDELEVAAHAINSHDKLIEGINEAVKYLAHHYWYIEKLEVIARLKGLIEHDKS